MKRDLLQGRLLRTLCSSLLVSSMALGATLFLMTGIQSAVALSVQQIGGGPSTGGPGGTGSGGSGSGGGGTATGGSPVRSSDPSNGRGDFPGFSETVTIDPPPVISCEYTEAATSRTVNVEDQEDCDCSSPESPAGDGGLIHRDTRSVSSCGSCSGAGLSVGPQPVSGNLSARDVGRIFIPNNQVNNGSFSPGYYSNLDSQLNIFPESGGTAIAFFDVVSKKNYLFVDGLDGDPLDGVFHDLRNYHSRKIELLNSSGVIVSSVSNANKAMVTHWSGFTETFELIDLDSDPAAEEYAGRLIERSDRIGRKLSLNYKSFTPTEIDNSPDRQWQIDTVSDDQGHTLTFTYDSSQHGGRWCVTKIARNDGPDLDFQYSGDKLSKVIFHDGSESTFTYGQDSVAQTATVTVYESASEGGTKKYHLTNDYMSLSTGQQEQVINQPVGVYRMVQDNSGDTMWQMTPASDPSVDSKFVFKGGNYAVVEYGDGTFQQCDSWSFSSGGGGGGPGGDIFVEETTIFNDVDVTLNSNVVGASSSTTTAQLRTGQLPSITDKNGRQRDFLYDADGKITKVTYVTDGTFEEFSYNSFGQVTRKRTREGNVVKNTYDSLGNLTTREVGLKDSGGSDVQTGSYAQSNKEYYVAPHVNAGLLKCEKSPLYTTGHMHRTDYQYDSLGNLTKKIEPADTNGGPRPETTYTYDLSGRLASTTDPAGRTTSHTYDDAGNLVQTTYPDGSTQQAFYATSGVAMGRLLKTKDRVGTVTTYTYDSEGRLIETLVGAAIDANILDGNPDDTVITDVNLQNKTLTTYLDGTDSLRKTVISNGAKTEYVYDDKNRMAETKRFPRVGKILVTKNVYDGNELFFTEDPYGRRKYFGYRASDGTLIRTVTATVPSFSLADFAAVWALSRDLTPNAHYIVHDGIRNEDGDLTKIINGREIETRYEYDEAGRETKKTEAWGTSVAAVTETDYDAAGNLIEVRSPRYFDSNDSEAYQKAKETWTYNGRGQIATHTVAAGSNVAATESFTYDLRGDQKTHTDFAGKVRETIDDSCCGKSLASKDPLGNGSIQNTDPARRVVHKATISDVDSHISNMLNPADEKTLAESTTRFDLLGRTVASTAWLVKRGSVDPVDPPIAGLDGISASDGLTTQYFYDSNLSDGVGLDSAGGVAFTKLAGSGSSSISLANAIAKLASSLAIGGAGVSFNGTSPGTATVVINGEDEVSFSINDTAGRSVMSGKMDAGTGSLVTWRCQLHDTVTNVSGFGDCLESISIDALGKTFRSFTDGAGRSIQAMDQIGKITSFDFDAAGNQLSVGDANGVGQDIVYDALSRAISNTDTSGVSTSRAYDSAGNLIEATDGKNNTTFYVFDARGRQKTQTDRLGGITLFSYDSTGRLLSLTDAENQTTSYTYDDAGNKLTEQYPDHTGGSPGSAGCGLVTFVNDALGRVHRKQDQAGNTVTYTYDLAGRLLKREYRTLANSPSGTIADTDTFTYDAARRMLMADSGRYNNTVAFTYNTGGRKATEALTISGQTYTTSSEYNENGQLTSYTNPNGTVVGRSYTDRGSLHQVSYDGTVVDTRTYDDGGRLTGSIYNNGIAENRNYNNDNTLVSITYTGASIGDLSYTWDENKNKTAESNSGAMSGYGFSIPVSGYDAEDRLVSYNRTDGNLDQLWNLSAVGDWHSVTTEGTVQSRTHGSSHELLTVGADSVVTDTRGNMTFIPSSARNGTSDLAMSWDLDNRMSSADVGNDGSADVTYKFDALGRRVARFTPSGTEDTIYIKDGQQTIAEYLAGGAASQPTYHYVYASYIDEPILRDKPTGSEKLYYHRNQQYSITALTNEAGLVVERYAYSAYGQPVILDALGTTVRTASLFANTITFTGREFDPTALLVHFRARMFSYFLGRFCSRDPIGYEDGENLYLLYTGLDQVDPSGLFAIKDIFDRVQFSGGGCLSWQWPLGPGFIKLSVCGTVEYLDCCSKGNFKEKWGRICIAGTLSYELGKSIDTGTPKKPKGGRNDRIPHPCRKGETVKVKYWAKEKAKCAYKGGGPSVGGSNSGWGCPKAGFSLSGWLFVKAKAGVMIGVSGSINVPVKSDLRIPDDLVAEFGWGWTGGIGASIEAGGTMKGCYAKLMKRGGCCK